MHIYSHRPLSSLCTYSHMYHHGPSFANRRFSPEVLGISFWKSVYTYIQLLRVRRCFIFEEIPLVDPTVGAFRRNLQNYLGDFCVVWTIIPQPQKLRSKKIRLLESHLDEAFSAIYFLTMPAGLKCDGSISQALNFARLSYNFLI